MPLVVHLQIRLVPPAPSLPFQRHSSRLRTAIRCCSSSNPRRHIRRPLPPLKSNRSSDQDLLQAALSSSDDGGGRRTHLPAVRSYETDLVRLSLVGDVGYDQALTAAAADGGDAAEEHLESGTPTMVVETLFPGSVHGNSTVSTRLFLPAAEVKDRAKHLQNRSAVEMLSKSVSTNILAMTFRQVVLQHVWSFQLEIFPPGTERDMNDLSNPREISAHCTVSSSDPRVLAAIAEAICSLTLNIVGNDCSDTISAESGVCISKIPVSQITKDVKSMTATFDLDRLKPAATERALQHKWWMPPTYPNLEKSMGSGVSPWVNEYIRAYKIQVDGAKFMDARFQGWQQSADNKQEVLLTYFQTVELANIIDMLYEDRFTSPRECLSYSLAAEVPKQSSSKNSLWDWTQRAAICGCFLLAVGVMTKFYSPCLFDPKKAIGKQATAFIADVNSSQTSLNVDELDSMCVHIIQNVKDALHYQGDIMSDKASGAWIGELPDCLRKSNNAFSEEFSLSFDQSPTPHRSEEDETLENMSTNAHSLFEGEKSSKMNSAQDVASYQVVLSKDGKIIGFQPTNRIAVNHWAENPLAKILYNNRIPSPWLLEPSLRMPRPEGIVLIELFVSVNPKSRFTLARALQC